MHVFKTKDELAKALADRIAGALQARVEVGGKASLAVSGGSTPVRLFQQLSNADIEWERVTTTLVDERCVPPHHKRSNAGLVHDHLLKNTAAAAEFVPLFDPVLDPDVNLKTTTTALIDLLPLTATVLGMGNDGHTASFFPDAADLSVATDPHTPQILTTIDSVSAGETRLTLTLPALLASELLILHIEGAEKRDVLERARSGGDPNSLPIRHILNHRDDLEIYWTD